MSQSFGIVEEKLREAGFFLDKLGSAGTLSLESKFYFSAFVSAARSITLALQATLNETDGFVAWYEQAQARMKLDPIAKYFVEIRNDSVHKGRNPLGQVTLEHLRENLLQQFSRPRPSHVIVMPDVTTKDGTILADAVQVSAEYFKSLVGVIFDCYDRFRRVVDPRWYFTRENFESRGKTIEDALEELGFPRTWLSGAISETDGWKILRRQQPACLVNDIFWHYIGRTISEPD
jgi:hypothetical protein